MFAVSDGFQYVSLEDGTMAWLATGMFPTDGTLSGDHLKFDSIDAQVGNKLFVSFTSLPVVSELGSYCSCYLTILTRINPSLFLQGRLAHLLDGAVLLPITSWC